MVKYFPSMVGGSHKNYVKKPFVVSWSYIFGFLIAISFYILLFSNISGVATFVQLAAIAIMTSVAIICAYRNFCYRPLSLFEIAFASICIWSPLSALVNYPDGAPDSPQYVALYTGLTIVVWVTIYFFTRSVDPMVILRSVSVAFILMILTVIFFYKQEIFTALSPGSENRHDLRVRAFELHPNLEGFIFGGGAVLLLWQATHSRGIFRLFCIFGFIASLAIVFSASSRAGLLAWIASVTLVVMLGLKKFSAVVRMRLIGVIAVIGLASAIYATSISKYVYEILELDSETRGVDSGGSGRSELWAQGWDLVMSSPANIMIGSGLRSSSPEYIGFSTESSFITILLDSGLIFGSILIISIFLSVLKSLYWIDSKKNITIGRTLLSAMMIYALFQSIFNRYLFAIGNPFSFFLLFIFAYASQGRLASASYEKHDLPVGVKSRRARRSMRISSSSSPVRSS